MNKKRIAHISHESHLYGASRSLLLFLEKMDLQRYDSFVVCPTEGLFTERIRALGLPVYICPRDFHYQGVLRLNPFQKIIILLEMAVYLLKISSFFFRKKIDLVYVNTIAHVSPIIASKL